MTGLTHIYRAKPVTIGQPTAHLPGLPQRSWWAGDLAETARPNLGLCARRGCARQDLNPRPTG